MEHCYVEREQWEVKIEKQGMSTTTMLDLWNLPSRQWKQLKVCARGYDMFYDNKYTSV